MQVLLISSGQLCDLACCSATCDKLTAKTKARDIIRRRELGADLWTQGHVGYIRDSIGTLTTCGRVFLLSFVHRVARQVYLCLPASSSERPPRRAVRRWHDVVTSTRRAVLPAALCWSALITPRHLAAPPPTTRSTLHTSPCRSAVDLVATGSMTGITHFMKFWRSEALEAAFVIYST